MLPEDANHMVELCRQIAREKDIRKLKRLIDDLHVMLRRKLEELRRGRDAAMPSSERYLRFQNLDAQQPSIKAQCSACGKDFKSEIKMGERLDDVLFRVRASYNAHECESRH